MPARRAGGGVSARLLLYEPDAGGHQAEHLLWIARAWRDRGRADRLVICAPPAIAETHPELPELAAASGGRVVWSPLAAAAAYAHLDPRRGRPIRRAIDRHAPQDALLMKLDHALAPLAARMPMGRARLSGLLFRPTLHYGEIGSPPASLREGASRRVRRALLARALRHPAVRVAFTLDPTAAAALGRLAPGVPGVAVPDPVPDEPVLRPAPSAARDEGTDHERMGH